MKIGQALAAVAAAGRSIEIVEGKPVITPGGPLDGAVVSALRDHRDEVILRTQLQDYPLAVAVMAAFTGSIRELDDAEHAENFPKLWIKDPRKRATITGQPLPPDTSGVVQ